MKLVYQVHSVSRDTVPMTANVNGKEREVTGEVLTVELAAPGSVFGLRFDDPDEAEKLFVKGKSVTLTFGKGK